MKHRAYGTGTSSRAHIALEKLLRVRRRWEGEKCYRILCLLLPTLSGENGSTVGGYRTPPTPYTHTTLPKEHDRILAFTHHSHAVPFIRRRQCGGVSVLAVNQ
jgi:hypothetical protein